MKKLDLYIIKKFLGSFFFMLAVIMSIAVVFDVSEKIDDFIQKEAPLSKIIFNYYLNFVFYYGNLFSSLLVFLTVLLFTSKMAQRSEIIAILSSGISFNRLLYPFFIASTVLVIISLYFTHYQLPIANKKRLAFEEQYVRNTFAIHDQHLHREIEPGTIAYFESFSYVNRTGYKFSIERWDEGGKLRFKMLADQAKYDTVSGQWHIINYFIRNISDSTETLTAGLEMDTIMNLKPSDLGQRLEYASQMSWNELNEMIELVQRRGSDKAVFYEIEKHQRTSYPVATYILTIIGVSIASRKSRGGIGVHLALGILLVFIYIFGMKVTTVAATNAGLDPLIAVWIPNFIYLLVSLWLYKNAQK